MLLNKSNDLFSIKYGTRISFAITFSSSSTFPDRLSGLHIPGLSCHVYPEKEFPDMTVEPPVTVTPPASLSHFVLSHFVIFNPTLQVPAFTTESDDKDLEDDLREAAQILFYTSREAGGVSRDRMLRQVGLAKGLMSFTEYVDETRSGANRVVWLRRTRMGKTRRIGTRYTRIVLGCSSIVPSQTSSSIW
jgi:hypothetical protein